MLNPSAKHSAVFFEVLKEASILMLIILKGETSTAESLTVSPEPILAESSLGDATLVAS